MPRDLAGSRATREQSSHSGFRIRIFFADPDPGKNFHADPDPGGIRGRGLVVKGKMKFFFEFFFHVSDDS